MIKRIMYGGFLVYRWLNGDRAYAFYLKHHELEHPNQAPLSRKAYYRHSQQERWSKINRCC